MNNNLDLRIKANMILVLCDNIDILILECQSLLQADGRFKHETKQNINYIRNVLMKEFKRYDLTDDEWYNFGLDSDLVNNEIKLAVNERLENLMKQFKTQIENEK